ncbi:hypothetical protein MVEG_12416 [Podila verticillata NRRL 6337]|uniref:Heterokaryon incompatibility domain-containing protein n=1 Tax=Podila verticillata NRRL 6337 TaxID=1069443 RepID=A0A086TIG9_9FUNG|nr:hypothetical protein MVEG_12416 [Podila verticillata NRRL 6337]
MATENCVLVRLLAHLSFSNMPLKLPVRLLDVSLMKVEMYRDIQDDVRKEGYICISHVWGDMKEYSASKLGIKGGVDWKIPLSDPKKLERIRKAVLHQKKKYCWLDLVCIPQGDDRLDERIVEIPHMGSYYEGATMTLVMATYRHPAPAIIRKPVGVIMGALYGTTSMSLKVANMSYRLTDLGMEEEEWFKRVWTFQEAIFSKSLKYVTYSGRHHDLTDILDKITDMSEGKPGDIDDILEHNHELDRLSYAIREYYKGKTDLVEVMSKACWRNRTKDHDVVYGVMAVLGYATLPVRYDITLEELNEAVVRYAYSQGDISWLSVGGNTGKGFIQPVCQTFTRVGKYWKSVNLEQSL